MSERPSVWTHLAADPVRIDPPIPDAPGLVRRLGLNSDPAPVVLDAGPRAAIVHVAARAGAPPGLHWAWLAEPARLLSGGSAVELALVLASDPLDPGGRTLRIVSRIRACLEHPGLIERARGAATREALVRSVAPLEEGPAEATLRGDEVLALLRSSDGGLGGEEARARARRAAVGIASSACGADRSRCASRSSSSGSSRSCCGRGLSSR